MARAFEGAMITGERRIHAYEQQVETALKRVEELVGFVMDEHFSVELLLCFWRGDKRARITVETIGRLLGCSLVDELSNTRDLLEEGLPLSIFEFSESIAPRLFNRIQAVQPSTPINNDAKAVVEQLHYAVDVRQALLQHVLTQFNQRFQAPRFRNLGEASRWTESYSGNLQLAEVVIQQTRELLKDEASAAKAYLQQTSQDIEGIETAAEVKLGIIKRLQWVGVLEEADNRIHNHLAGRAEQLESVAFSMLSDTQRSSFIGSLARRTLENTPKLGMYLLGLAGVAGGVGVATENVSELPDTLLAKTSKSIRREVRPEDTAQAVALNTGGYSTRSVRHVTDAVRQLTTDVRAENRAKEPASQAQQKVTQFFNKLEGSAGRQTFVIENEEELRALVVKLVDDGYRQDAVLTLLGLHAFEDFQHPLTLDIRDGQVMPILFPGDQTLQNTAAPPATNGKENAPTLQPSSSPIRTASRQPALNLDERFIVYRVQPGEELSSVAQRYGTTVEQIQVDNNLVDANVAPGSNLLIRRPSSPPSSDGVSSKSSSLGTSRVDDVNIRSRGSFGQSVNGDLAQGANARTYSPVESQQVVTHYGDTLFSDLESMPPDARAYLLTTVQEIADFFDVRPGDLLGIMRLEQNNAGWRLQEKRVSSAGATGVTQIVPRTWNGWANPQRSDFVRDVLDIEEHGGLGFDWSKRNEWRAWKEGKVDRSVLQDSDADPTVFENGVAGVARHLVNWGVTRDYAQRDPAGFAKRLADAIAVYNSGQPLATSADWVQSSANRKTTGQYVVEAMATAEQVSEFVSQPSVSIPIPGAINTFHSTFHDLYDKSFGVALSEEEIRAAAASNGTLQEDVRLGKVDAKAAAVQLLEQIEQQYIAEGRNAILSQKERPWPHIHNQETLYVQKTATNLLGHPLSLYEIDDLMYQTRGDRDAILSALRSRADARLFAHAKHLYDQMLNRTERGLSVRNSEVGALLQPFLVGHSPDDMDQETLQRFATQIQEAIKELDEYKQLHPFGKFKAMPLQPMPRVFKSFGVPVDYQSGGRHTGIDIANPRMADGSEPPIFAVDDGTVVHVGPLYCNEPRACRGGKAIVLDHGNHVYSLYSHNNRAEVRVGERVRAGQRIGLQGNEGYSFGSHLHFEVHVGAPFTGNWETPFNGGEFVDPTEWLPHR
ncbi:MAG: peptidoglycan DD-metalloendopeptidase family protein [Chloroflexota bacterium]|nr:peptidoglycan DD-metalloendopeptidase family protein [Chloroflexota bacterium]